MNQLDVGCLEIEDLAAMKSVCSNLESSTLYPYKNGYSCMVYRSSIVNSYKTLIVRIINLDGDRRH